VVGSYELSNEHFVFHTRLGISHHLRDSKALKKHFSVAIRLVSGSRDQNLIASIS
jgi:hypothetical protein